MIDRLLSDARRLGTPLINGRRATFVWAGSENVQLMGDWTNWENSPVEMPVRSDGLQTLTLEFPEDAYLEYAFFDPLAGRKLPDSLNPNTVADGMGSTNHFVAMPKRPTNDLIRRRPQVARGSITKHRAETDEWIARPERAVHLYRPPGVGPVPLLVVLDGLDYLRRGKLAQIVDNLIAKKRIRPLAMALVHHGGSARKAEYGCSDGTLAFLERNVLPLARRDLDLLEPPYGVLGASMGGLMGLCSAVRRPDLFNKVISQSGAFTLNGFEMSAFDFVRHFAVAPIEVWMDVGRFEGFLDANRLMHTLLIDRGYPVTYREYQAGHCFSAWRDDVFLGLEAMYPPV